MRTSFLRVLFFSFIWLANSTANPTEIKVSKSNFFKEIGFSSAYTNHLNASIEQMQKPQEINQDFISTPKVGLGYKRDYGNNNSFYGIYRFNWSRLVDINRFANRSHSLFLQSNNNLSKFTILNLSINSNYYDYYNLDVLTNMTGNLEVFLKQYLIQNFLVEFVYNFSMFTAPEFNDNMQYQKTSMTYGLTENTAHRLNQKTMQWVAKSIKYGIESEFAYIRYDKINSMFLQNLTGISAGINRTDFLQKVKPSVTYLPVKHWVIKTGYVFEFNRSNSDYYSFESNGGAIDVVYIPSSNHKISLSGLYSYYDYFSRRFDSRYLNTKKDYRFYGSISYEYNLSEKLKFIVSDDFKWNESNDKKDYDRLYTNSYTSFNVNNISLETKYSF